MYCVNCGVKLADSEKICPLCATEVYHPQIQRGEGERSYPRYAYPSQEVNSKDALIIITALFMLPAFITAICDVQINGYVSWSGYVIGGLTLAYAVFVFPFWLKKPRAIGLIPLWTAITAVYLFYINRSVGGSWFLSFALPVTVFLGVLLSIFTVLLRLIRANRLYLYGATVIVLGFFVLLIEYLIYITFSVSRFFGWSLYPMVILIILGVVLILLAGNKSYKEAMERKFYL